MSRLVSRAESWEKVYTSFQNINFASFDYDTIKQSILDYIKLYFPESFNDFIETDEMIAIIESFAYVAELIAYRLDMNAHENFISTAERQDSILRLAKLVSYSADRPLPNRGLVKITSVSTTEGIIDSVGNNLSNKSISWNDTSNSNWKDQFILVMNRVLSQSFGTVSPVDRFQLQDVLFELYDLNTTPLQPGVFKYSTSVNGTTVPMELVPVEYDSSQGIVERRPYNNSNFSILYAQDGLGDASETTGFLCYTKQGSLQRFRHVFDGITPNQFFEIPVNSVNNTDVWVNNIDPNTGAVLDVVSTINYKRDTVSGKSGEWVEVDTSHAQNVIFNTNPKRNKYEVETRANNRIRIIFGDGEFADIPSGTFDVWVRTSLDQDVIVSQSAVINVPKSFSYVDSIGRTQTLTFTFSLINSLQNGSAAESLEHIRLSAPSVYYAQDRMVNGNDYNTFMLQDSSILKLCTINRTFAGDSQYIAWHDPSTTYENVKLFGDDGAIYYETKSVVTTTDLVDVNTLITSHVQPLLSSTDIFIYVIGYGVPINQYRRLFNSVEFDALITGLTPPPSPSNVDLYYNIVTYDWHVVKSTDDPAEKLTDWLTNYITTPLITILQTSTSSAVGETYNITRYANRLNFHSPTTKFWDNNSANRIIDYTTLTSNYDTISILQANTNYNRNNILGSTWKFNVMGQDVYDSGSEIGLPDITKLSILPMDVNGDGIPDYLNINDVTYPQGLADIIKPKLQIELPNPLTTNYIVTLPIQYVTYVGDVTVTFSDLTPATKGLHWSEITNTSPHQTVDVGNNKTSSTLTGLSPYSDYRVKIYVDSVLQDGILSGSYVQTYGALVVQLNTTFPTITASIVSGNIRISSNTNTPTSSILIDDSIFQTGNVNVFCTAVNSQVLDGIVQITSPTTAAVSNTVIIYPTIDSELSIGDRTRTIYVSVNDYVYFNRTSTTSSWNMVASTTETILSYASELALQQGLWKRQIGRSGLNFGWFHITPSYHLIDPAATNIMDMFVIQKGYFLDLKRWLENPTTTTKPTLPSPLDMRLAYNYLLDNRMLSDTVVLHPGVIKILFGKVADPTLQANFVVIKDTNTLLTDNQIKTIIVTTVRNYFDPTVWEFGETFYFSELAAAIHASLITDIKSVVLVPTYVNNHFGDLYEIVAREDEIFYPDISVSNITLVTDYNSIILRSGTTATTNTTKQIYDTTPPPTVVPDCVYVDRYCELDYCDTDYIASLNCVIV